MLYCFPLSTILYNKMASALRVLAYVYTAEGSLGLIVNIAQLVSIYRNKNQRSSVFGLALLSLNIADILASLSFTFAGSVLLAVIFKIIDLKLFRDLSNVLTASIVFSMTLSFSHVVFVALQRMLAVAFPLRVKRIITKSRCYIILAFLLIISVGLASMRFFYIEVSVVLSLLAIVVGIMLIVMYSVICFKTMRRSIEINFSEAQRRCQQSDTEVLLYSIAITIVFITCNYPISLKNFIDYPQLIFTVSNVLFGLNPFLDTMLYFVWSYYKRRRRANLNNLPSEANFTTTSKESDVEQTTRL